jgi:hypothetical protein
MYREWWTVVRVEPWVTLGFQRAQEAGVFVLKRAGETLGCRKRITRVAFPCLIVFFSSFFAAIPGSLNPEFAQNAPGSDRAQTAPQHEVGDSRQGVIRITVNLVQVDAVVADSNGHQVTNLRPEDFEILEDGHPQTITNFSYVTTAKPGGTEAHPATPPATPGVPLVAPVRLEPDQVRRSIVILVDDLHIAFENMVYVRKALHKLIDNDVQPGDLVAILHTSGGLGVLQQFTNDKRELHAEIDALRFYLLGGFGLSADSAAGKLLGATRSGVFPNGDKDDLEAIRKVLMSPAVRRA